MCISSVRVVRLHRPPSNRSPTSSPSPILSQQRSHLHRAGHHLYLALPLPQASRRRPAPLPGPAAVPCPSPRPVGCGNGCRLATRSLPSPGPCKFTWSASQNSASAGRGPAVPVMAGSHDGARYRAHFTAPARQARRNCRQHASGSFAASAPLDAAPRPPGLTPA